MPTNQPLIKQNGRYVASKFVYLEEDVLSAKRLLKKKIAEYITRGTDPKDSNWIPVITGYYKVIDECFQIDKQQKERKQ